MAKHSIRRWLQFGVLDLLLATSIVAAVVTMYRPIQAQTTSTMPWLYGTWGSPLDEPEDSRIAFMLHPDGFYAFGALGAIPTVEGKGWTLTTEGLPRGTRGLTLGAKGLVVRFEADGLEMVSLDEGGKVVSRLRQLRRLEGLLRDGAPDGPWRTVEVARDRPAAVVILTYRKGTLVDAHHEDTGRRDLEFLKHVRDVEGLPPRTAKDSITDGRSENIPHD